MSWSGGSFTQSYWLVDIIDQLEDKNVEIKGYYCTHMDDKRWQVLITFMLLDEWLVMV